MQFLPVGMPCLLIDSALFAGVHNGNRYELHPPLQAPSGLVAGFFIKEV
jgi:hypothetical protein